jgi:hypothetical protein
VRSARGAIGRVTAGDEGVIAGVSADTGLSGLSECGIIDIAIDMSAKPIGNAIHPAHPAAGSTRRRICWSRDWGPGSDGDGSTSPCHSHKPVSLVSVLTNAAEGDIGGVPIPIGAVLYAWSISSPDSACMAHNSLLVVATSPVQFRAAPPDGLRPHRFRNRRRWPYRLDVLWHGRSAIEAIIVLK